MLGPSYDSWEAERKADETECHRCPVVCERVVYPTHCLRSGCRFVYSFDEGSSRYFGCLRKIFVVELDIAPFLASPRRDMYGAVRARTFPRDECHMRVEQAYRFRYSWQACANPTFLQHPDDYTPEAVRLLVDGPPRSRE